MRLYQRGKVWWCSFYTTKGRVQKSTRCMDREAAADVARRYEREAAEDLSPELNAMAALEGAMKELSDSERTRVLAWAQSRWGIRSYVPTNVVPMKRPEPAEETVTLGPRRPGPRSRLSMEKVVAVVIELDLAGPSEIAARLGTTMQTAHAWLRKAVAAGEIDKVRHGKYGPKGSAPDPDLVSSLINLGYERKDSEKIASLARAELGEEATFEEAIKFALGKANGEVKA